ncbi:hypothetical protein TSOC_013277 [Tetrabaena socialis]|uniref:Uncharacterized protein n=1 Tax=Tetrabaena socialis TaxID=47790 RepID=A0A2J7ZKT8_9CHLO|nr:hypothetical protein TSOC_013277 [Tetrabaena socialis]|eukprot:PNH00871.1 hypothetical protein TSOC_013277 [Tetrabaena socialis]
MADVEPGPDGTMALLLRSCRLLIESSRMILVAQRGAGVSEGETSGHMGDARGTLVGVPI